MIREAHQFYADLESKEKFLARDHQYDDDADSDMEPTPRRCRHCRGSGICEETGETCGCREVEE